MAINFFAERQPYGSHVRQRTERPSPSAAPPAAWPKISLRTGAPRAAASGFFLFPSANVLNSQFFGLIAHCCADRRSLSEPHERVGTDTVYLPGLRSEIQNRDNRTVAA